MKWISKVKWRDIALLALFSSVMFFGQPAHAGEYGGSLQGRVVGVTDGDTVTVLDSDNRQHEIRLAAIDAPETSCHARKPSAWDDQCVEQGQPFGRAAKLSLSKMVYGKEVNVELQTVGGRGVEADSSYGREIGTIWVDNLNANLEQVRRGYAMVYRQYAKRVMLPDDYQEMIQAEQYARDHQLGLWSEPHPLAPWDYRHRGGGYHGE